MIKRQIHKDLRRLALLLITVTLALSACSGSQTTRQMEKSLGDTLKQYETIVRWSQWDAAVDFIAPEYLLENPISQLDMDRLRLFHVTTYTIRSAGRFDGGMTARQVVEIKMYNKRQGVERSYTDNQEWRYDEESKRWRLHSGLPDPTQRY
ncbi:MAG: hypothetical protein V2I79_11625 [Xanthomonadales bacterium]|jgi:hypothetical protein|nr:hypothetical protein [Xanthomonadales bacterium]